MSDRKEPCQCKSSLGHYLSLVTGVIKLVTLILGIVFSGEVATDPNPWLLVRQYLDKIAYVFDKLLEND